MLDELTREIESRLAQEGGSRLLTAFLESLEAQINVRSCSEAEKQLLLDYAQQLFNYLRFKKAARYRRLQMEHGWNDRLGNYLMDTRVGNTQNLEERLYYATEAKDAARETLRQMKIEFKFLHPHDWSDLDQSKIAVESKIEKLATPQTWLASLT